MNKRSNYLYPACFVFCGRHFEFLICARVSWRAFKVLQHGGPKGSFWKDDCYTIFFPKMIQLSSLHRKWYVKESTLSRQLQEPWIGDGDRKVSGIRGDPWYGTITSCDILTSYIRAARRTCRGFPRVCCHVAWSKMVRVARFLRIFYSDVRD